MNGMLTPGAISTVGTEDELADQARQAVASIAAHAGTSGRTTGMLRGAEVCVRSECEVLIYPLQPFRDAEEVWTYL